MTLLDRYVHAVKRHLPKGQQEDIAAELREAIQSQIEAEEAARGRSLTEDEVAGIIKKFGRPLSVAGQYGSPQYLIGPRFFPYYRFVLKVLLWIGAPILLFALTVSALASDNALVGVGLVIAQAASLAWAAFGIVTLVFWRLERLKANIFDDWNPRELPKIPESSKVIPRFASLNSAIVMTAYFLWWVDLLPIDVGRLVGWPGADAPIHLGPAWQAVYFPIIVLLGIDITFQWINVWKPRVTKWRIAVEVLTDLAGLAVIYYLVKAGQLVVVTRQSWMAAADRINDAAIAGLVVLGVLIAIGLVDEVKHLLAHDVPTVRTA